MRSRLLPLFLIFVFAAPASFAQSTFGTIVGIIKDPGEGFVTGAQIALTNLDDNSTRFASADDNGTFQFTNLKPGKYQLTVQANGFSEYKAAGVELEARQSLRLDLTLKLASSSQTVEVTGDSGPLINTESATLGDTKNSQQLTGLPVNYRGATTSPLAMLSTVPGAQQDANGNVSIGGGLPSQIQYSVDGASTVNIRQNGALGNMNPSSELIGEFRVTQFNNNAEFAQLGDVTITTKNGTEQFHGSLFEYAQNSAMDAEVWNSGDKPHKVFNTFGGSLGGPLSLPKWQHGKPKTFFFADYEGNRRRYSTPLFLNVPTSGMRQGNFNGVLSPTTGQQISILDPFTGQPFLGNIIPSNCSQPDCLNPTALALLQSYLPAPNTSSTALSPTAGNYFEQVPTPGNTNGYDLRVDRTLTSRQSIFVRWSWKHLDTTIPNNFLPSDRDLEHNRNLIFSHNYLLTNNLVNEARFGLSLYQLQVLFPIQGAQAVSTLGLQGLDLSDHPSTSAFPSFNFSDGTSFTPIGRDKTGVTQSDTLQFADNLTWIRGKHTLKFGVDVRRVSYQDIESFGGSDDFGSFTFNQGTFTGDSFADFLLGLPTKTYVAQSGPDVHAHALQTGVYGQDEWRFNEKLTLTLGLRWQALPPFVSDQGNLTAFSVNNGGIIIPGQSLPRPAFLESINSCDPANPNNPADPCGGPVNPTLGCAPVTLADHAGLGPGLRQFYKRNFQPRLGFAYRPFGNSKTVIRGGFGIFTMTNLGQLSFNTTNIHVSVVRTTSNPNPISGAPTYQFPYVRTADNPLTIAGTGDFYQNTLTNFRDPQSAQWNLTLERELTRNITLRESYLGMNSYRMSQTVDLNQVAPSSIFPNPNPKPYPNWGRILSTTNQGNVNYQAMQSELNVRARGGLTTQASYIWAKNLGNVGGDAPTSLNPEIIYGTPVANRFDLAANRGNIAQTRRNRLVATAIYEFPVGKNRKFFSHLNHFSETLIGGWSFSSVALWETGPYLTPITSPSYDPGNLNLAYRGAYQRPDCLSGRPAAGGATGSIFNINEFNPVPSGPAGTCGVGILVGPGTTTIAVGLAKKFVLSERFQLRLEGTFTNILNHPNFAPPSTDVTSPSTFGVLTSVQTAENSGNRTGQVSLRLQF
jgi:hypothetical protein